MKIKIKRIIITKRGVTEKESSSITTTTNDNTNNDNNSGINAAWTFEEVQNEVFNAFDAAPAPADADDEFNDNHDSSKTFQTKNYLKEDTNDNNFDQDYILEGDDDADDFENTNKKKEIID